MTPLLEASTASPVLLATFRLLNLEAAAVPLIILQVTSPVSFNRLSWTQRAYFTSTVSATVVVSPANLPLLRVVLRSHVSHFSAFLLIL